jgi:MFS family permease
MNPAGTAQIPEETTGRPRRVAVGGIALLQTFRALRHRNFRLFLIGQAVSLIGTWMEQTAMAWIVYQLTDSKMMLGLLAAAGSAPMLFFSVWGGSLADRYSKRSILVATQSISMLLAFALAALVWHGNVQAWQIMIIAILSGVVMAFDMPPRQAFVIEMTSREDLMNAISLNSSVFNGARVIGPSLAGLLMAKSGAAVCFFLNGISFLAVIISLLTMRLPKIDRSTSATAESSHALGGFSYVWQHPRVLTILTLFGVVGIFGWSYSVLMPAFARDVLHLSEAGFGILLSANGVGALAGALTVAAAGDKFHPRTLALCGVWIFSAALIGFAFTRNFSLSMALLAIAGFGLMLFFSTSNTTVQTIVPDEIRGRIMGVWSLVFGAMIPLGGVEAGALARWIGAPGAIAVGAIVCAIAAVITLFIVRRRESLARAADSISTT